MGWRQFTNFYSKIRQNKTKQKTQKRKKKERRKDSGTKTTFIVFYSLLTQAWFTPNFRRVVGKSNSLSLPVSLLFLSCALCMWRLKCRTHCVCCCCCAQVRLTNESQLKKRNRKRKYRCFLKMCRSFMAISKNPSRGQPGPATSMFLWGQTSCYADPSALRQGNSKCVYLIMCYLCFCFRSLHSFMWLKKKKDLSSILSVKWIFVIVSLLQNIFFFKENTGKINEIEMKIHSRLVAFA